MKKFGILFSSILLLSTFLCAQAVQWNKTPCNEWSHGQVYSILNGSPWTGLIFAGCVLPEDAIKAFGTDRIFFRIRLLTAEPVRLALLRKLSLREMTVDVSDLMEGRSMDYRLSSLIASRPNDIRVAGDDHNIVLAVTVIAITDEAWEEYTDEGSLLSSCLCNCADAFLMTNRGRRVALARYEPPGPDRLGAKLYFPRNLPDGSPFISPDDRSLRFEARFKDKQVSLNFDLRKMEYRGKLEL